jgi:hypothetical protein
MGRIAQVITVSFVALAAFQLALAAGAPLGDAAWGGAQANLTTGQRVASAVAVIFYVAAILVVRGCDAGQRERRYRWGTWGLGVVLGIAGVANIASNSPWENYLLAPVAIVLAALCFALARTTRTNERSGEGARPPKLRSAT